MDVKLSLRDRILSLAQDKMLKSGQGPLSLRQIATELGVTPMAFYRHFENKEALLLCLLDVGFNRFGESLARSKAAALPLQRLELLADGFIDFAIDNPGFFELMFLSSQVPPGLRNREALLAASQPTYTMLVDITRACIAAGILPDTKPEVMARDMLAFCIGQGALFISAIMGWSPEEARQHSRTAFSRYLATMIH